MNTLEIEGLTVTYGHGRHAVTAVDDVSLAVAPGKVYGLVGESGSGKSTLARATVGLLPVAAGAITVAGQRVTGESRHARRERARRVQLIFQDPYSSLDPRMTIRQIIGESLRLRTDVSGAGADAEIGRLLELVNLEPAYARRLPRELSGGQRQRVAIARALAVRPKLIVADEITSALDVSVQAHVLNVIREIQQAEGLSMLFISHNLATVRYISDEIGVMYRGRLVESGPTERVVEAPTHEYTRELLRAVPVLRIPASPMEAAS
ncbi:ABC transporter ATP-binding protein [Dactylosporangium sp. CA-092794]|uniref:ABC transporter ATP-binding protein n=1 Tax=Dactylosporangium sp. CA-092794 TaxID=3239929 RepID=UPI003D8B0B71